MKDASAFRRRALRLLPGVLVLLFSWSWSSAGIVWERRSHPDERLIVKWIGQVRDEGCVTDRVYPGGWFQLFRVRLLADGVEDFFRARTLQGPSDPVFRAPGRQRRRGYGETDARRFNAGLHALAAFFLYLCGLECGFGLAAAAFGASLFVFHPLPLEFLHYCETDSALVFSGAVALWLLLRALRTRNAAWSVAASFACGFAVACKYTLAPLAPVPPVLAALAAAAGDGPPARRARTFAVLFLAGAAAFAGGFLLGTPLLLRDPGFFVENMHQIGRNTYAEMSSPLGDRAGRFFAPVAHRVGTFLSESAKAGPWIWGWFAVSLGFSARRNAPGTRAAVPVLCAAMLLYYAFGMPWMRSQEGLPLVLFLAAVSGAPVDWALRALRGGPPRRRAAAALVLAAGLLALGSAFSRGSRLLCSFRDPDRRSLCGSWLRVCAPESAAVAFDSYAEGAARSQPCTIGAARRWAEYWDGSPVVLREDGTTERYGYFVRNTYHIGRDSNRHLLFPRRLLPEAAARVAAFEADSPLLLEWRLPDKDVRPVFAQHDVELRALPGDGAGADLPPVVLPFDRPAAVLSDRAPLWVPAEAAPVGPEWTVRLVGRRSSVRVPPVALGGAPGAPVRTGETWGIVRSTPDAADLRVEWDDLFAGGKAALPPGGAAVAPLSRLSLRTASLFDLFPEARLRARGEERGDACRAGLSSDPAEVVRALRTGGDPAAACRFARSRKALPPDAAAEAFLAAVAAGEAPDPAWRARAEEALSACDALFARVREAEEGRAPFPASAMVRGAPVSAHLDFARLRLPGVFPVFPGERLHAVLPPGRYRVRFTASRASAPVLPGMRLFAEQDGPVRPTGAERAFETFLSVRRTTALRFSPSLPSADPEISPAIGAVEISWNPLEALERSAEELRAALAAAP